MKFPSCYTTQTRAYGISGGYSWKIMINSYTRLIGILCHSFVERTIEWMRYEILNGRLLVIIGNDVSLGKVMLFLSYQKTQ